MTWVHDRIFAAGGRHIPEAWAEFQKQTQITAVLHVNPARPQPFAGPAPAAFMWLDVADEAEIETATLELAGRFLEHAVGHGERALIHGGQGRHRTRWTYVAFLLCSGKSVAGALRTAAEPPWLAPYHTDRDRWHSFADHLSQHQRSSQG